MYKTGMLLSDIKLQWIKKGLKVENSSGIAFSPEDTRRLLRIVEEIFMHVWM